MGLRPGTENLPEILKFSKALKSAQKIKEQETKRISSLWDYFLKKLLKLKNQNFDFLINGDLKNRLPNNINITFSKIPSDLLVMELSAKGIMASSKSASSGKAPMSKPDSSFTRLIPRPFRWRLTQPRPPSARPRPICRRSA